MPGYVRTCGSVTDYLSSLLRRARERGNGERVEVISNKTRHRHRQRPARSENKYYKQVDKPACTGGGTISTTLMCRLPGSAANCARSDHMSECSAALVAQWFAQLGSGTIARLEDTAITAAVSPHSTGQFCRCRCGRNAASSATYDVLFSSEREQGKRDRGS